MKRGISSPDSDPRRIETIRLYGGQRSFELFHLWRINEFKSRETFGIHYTGLPYWLITDLSLIKHVMNYHDYNLDLPLITADQRQQSPGGGPLH